MMVIGVVDGLSVCVSVHVCECAYTCEGECYGNGPLPLLMSLLVLLLMLLWH